MDTHQLNAVLWRGREGCEWSVLEAGPHVEVYTGFVLVGEREGPRRIKTHITRREVKNSAAARTAGRRLDL